MKAIFDKALNTFGAWTRGSDPTVQQPNLRETSQVSPLPVISSDHLPPDSMFTTDTCIADDVLYRKNGVFLKYHSPLPGQDSLCTNATPQPLESEGAATKMDNHVLVPGYLFIASRGSNYGSTLILNWASNTALALSCGTCSDLEGVADSGSEDRAKVQPCVETYSGQQGFSVSLDLSTMEVIRVFCRKDDEGVNASGELVLKSEDQTFKVFYFKNGGLDVLVQLFLSWKHFNHICHSDTLCHTFTVHAPKLSLSELHPMEGKFSSSLTNKLWCSLLDSDGRVVDFEQLCKVIFFKGISSSLRKEVWPIILKVYDFKSSKREKELFKQGLIHEYHKIDQDRLHKNSLLPEKVLRTSYEALEKQVYKDVLRTDRNMLYYRGDDNQNLQVQLRIMMNYLHYKPEITYAQGMTDFLAPMLSVLDDDITAFWCFAKFMESCPILKDAVVNIKYQLDLLRLLLEMLVPSFYYYLEQMDGGLTLMFCHRWLLVFLKREFNEHDIMLVWEACWTSADTKYFHLFICVAIIAIYGERAQKKQMNINELMIYFNSLSLQMPTNIVMCQARGYLHQFCVTEQVDCALCIIMDDSFWHEPNSPTLACTACKEFGSCSRKRLSQRTEAIC